MERIREAWGNWWKVLGIFVLIGAALALVVGCQRSERSKFLDCFNTSIGSGQTLYYGTDAHYEQISRYDAVQAAKTCYDDRGITGDGEPPDYR